jgi:carbon-monoxide dehydrogenase medium subunit
VIPPSFTYVRASSVDEALELAAEHGEDAKYLAGGHSLLPLMKLRMASPAVLIDLGRITELSYIRDEGTYVAIGALTRHHDVATSAVLAADIPLLAHTAGEVGDPQIRHRGTIGGSVAHGDSASDLPATLLALDATFVIRGESGSRSVPAAEFFKSIFETAIEPGELLTEIQVPKPAIPSAWSFQKFTKRAIDWAIVGVAVQGTSVALISMGMTPLRATAVESALASGASIADAASLAAEGTSAGSDIHGSKAYREHLARVLVRRGLEEAASRVASVSLLNGEADDVLVTLRAGVATSELVTLPAERSA